MVKRYRYIQQFEKWIDKPMIKVITGIRRCGKSYLMKMIIELLRERNILDESICYLNLELFENSHLKDANALYEHIKKNTSDEGKSYVLIDEVQNCDGWERVVASLLAEERYDIYLTGSNATMLSGDLATHIAGRYIEIKAFPLSFNEFKVFNKEYHNTKKSIEDMFNDYLKYGGFPGLFTVVDDDEAKRQYLSGVRNTVILRDTVQRYDIRDVDLLQRVMNYVFDNVGQVFSANSVTNYLKSLGFKASLVSVNTYLDALTDAMIIEKAKRYDIKGRKIMQRMEKYYISDLGIRYSEIGYRNNDIGQLLENVVYNELLVRGYQVFVGKEGEKEVDFVATKGDERIYIQVTYLLATPEVVEREYGSLLSIKDAYPKLVLSMDRMTIGIRDGVVHQYLPDFLLEQ